MEINVNNRKILALTVCAVISAGAFVGCGDSNKKGDGAGHMYSAALASNPESLDPQFATDPSSATVIKNLYSGLVMQTKDGSIVCCNAESYNISEDGCVYTFKLREDNYWFFDENEDDKIDEDEYFPVTADDYVFAFRRILDPSMHSPFARDFMCLANSKKVSEGSYATTSLGVEALDDHTLQITLEKPCAELLMLLATPAAFPCNEEFFLSTKGRYGLDDRSVMSNGPFYVRQWFYDPYGSNNILYMRKNEVNENDKYEVLPSYVSFSVQDSDAEVRQCFKDEEAECFSTLKLGGYNSGKYNVTGQKAMTLGLVFNPDDKLYSNPAIRKAVALATDKSTLEKEKGSDIQPAYGIIPPAVNILGRSYRELSADKQFDVFDIDQAQELVAQAKSELKVSSIDSVKVIVDSSTIDSRHLHILSQEWQDSLGIYIGIEDLTTAEFNARISSGEYSIALYPLKADFNSGIAVFDKFGSVDCLKKAVGGQNISENILESTSIEELVNIYTATERTIIDQYGFIPLFYKSSYLVTNKYNEDLLYDPFTGAIDYRIAKNYS